jgi:3-oxoacyl-(acyl-carrier-protein) synthase
VVPTVAELLLTAPPAAGDRDHPLRLLVTHYDVPAFGGQAVVAALCAMRDRKLPHTAGTSQVDPEARFEVVTAAPAAIGSGHVQVNAFGFGGQNASVVLGAG